MSIELYQKKVNEFDREIANLEKKKADCDKKAADYDKRAMNVSISKNASVSTIKSKNQQIARYNDNANKEKSKSADLSKKIYKKREQRNSAYKNLQKEALKENQKSEKIANKLLLEYENRIRELEVEKNNSFMKNISLNDSSVCYDVFISHAFEDKETFVDDFVASLEKEKISVWYDSNNILWGDSLRESIDKGLQKSKFGIVVLSPDYIKEGKYWTKQELNALFQLETINGKTILPIWHNLTKKDVLEYSPIIADRNAMNTTMLTPEEIASELSKLLKNNN